ncbi:radical SAM protein [Pseudomonas putida]|uniref:radical SAM protein n=1 Tax=Pseudomonas putida TaxID=303 RepID=UPI0023647CEC|nr:radical SAM protein [Pseudomonas putida]MDD2139582.1 radical SAM protein [Pseudomonas putida]HDS1721505.1 radical SAM protein [Pseudomonas putida]
MKIENYSLPRNRSIEMMSTTISTNLNCNMACKHCYIQPELLRIKEYIDEATYRRCVEVIIEAFHLDESVTYLHLDVLGGEATLMPFEFWERNLPWTLDRVSELNDAGIQTEFTFCSNLMWRDERYLELLRAHKHHPAMDIAISFEGPESGRFGRNMAIFPKFLKRIEALGDCNMLNLVLIMGQGIIDLGPQYIIDTFVKRGITDVTCDMVFPWGSGKAYFDQHQPQYADVARFIAELTDLGKPYGLTVDHLDDMQKSLRTLSRSQNTLNDAYEYHWDQKGNLALNPNQTGTEAVLPYVGLHAWDENAALKIVWGNSSELDNKLSYEHDFCRDCKYLQACNSGWYPHKGLEADIVRKYMVSTSKSGFSCPGFFELWEREATHSFDAIGVTRYGDERRIRKAKRIARAAAAGSRLIESNYAGDYEGFFNAVKAAGSVEVFDGELFGLSTRQRLWFYDRIGCVVSFSGGVSTFSEASSIIAHAVSGNYHTIDVAADEVSRFCTANPRHVLTAYLLDALAVVREWAEAPIAISDNFARYGTTGLEVSFKYEDLLIWVIRNNTSLAGSAVAAGQARGQVQLTPPSYDYMHRLKASAYRVSRIMQSSSK